MKAVQTVMSCHFRCSRAKLAVLSLIRYRTNDRSVSGCKLATSVLVAVYQHRSINMTVSLQGLQVECVGMPMHLVNKMGMPDSQEERFVDVFDGGMLLTRQAADRSCMPIRV